MMSMMIGRGATLVVAAVLAWTRLVPRLGNALVGAAGIHDAAALPDHIGICGRGWTRDALDRRLSLAELRARDGVEPVVVDAGLLPPCPVGPCTAVAQDGPCHTVIYVRVGEDAYIDYALQGGP
nr:glycogen synthase kinase-3 binding protein [uncultured bacterium]